MRKLLKGGPSPALVISCIALFMALGSVGYSATGGNFILGNANTAENTSALSSGVTTGPTMNVTNTGGRSAARFTANAGITPFSVSNTTKIGSLNSDLLDSLDSTAFLRATANAGGDLSGPFGNLQLNAGVVTSAEVLDDTAGGGLNPEDLGINSVGALEIQTDGVSASEIANDSIDSGEVVDFGLSNQDIGVLFAEVNASGTIANSSGGVTGSKIGAAGSGQYEIDFARNITSCSAVATIGPPGAGSATGEVNVADRVVNVEAVFVDTNTSAGAASDQPFRLIVVC
jgi:hypothetical protein